MGQKRHVEPAGSWRTRHERRISGLLTERETLMNEIALRTRLNALPPMLAKARTLLTRYWGRANWQSRAEILPVARMLLVLGAAEPGLKRPARVAPPKRRVGKRAMAVAPRPTNAAGSRTPRKGAKTS